MFKSGTFKCYKNSLDVHFNEGECGGCGGEFPRCKFLQGSALCSRMRNHDHCTAAELLLSRASNEG